MFCPSSFDKLIIWLLLKLERSVPEGGSCYDGSDLADHQSDFINRLHHTSHLLMQQEAEKVWIYCLICVQLIHLRRSKIGCLRCSQEHPHCNFPESPPPHSLVVYSYYISMHPKYTHQQLSLKKVGGAVRLILATFNLLIDSETAEV